MSHTFPFRQIGDFQITALSDGTMSASLDLLSGIERADADVIQSSAGIDKPGDIHINCYLIRGRGRVIACASIDQNNPPPAANKVTVDMDIAGFIDSGTALNNVRISSFNT